MADPLAAAVPEQRNPNTRGIDLLPTRAAVALLVREQSTAVETVSAPGNALAAAVDAAAERLGRGVWNVK